MAGQRRASRSRTFAAGAEAVRAISQSGLFPTQLPPARRRRGGGLGRSDGGRCVAGARLRVGRPPRRCVDRTGRDVGPRPRRRPRRWHQVVRRRAADDGTAASREGAAGTWRNSFVRAPYQRDALARLGAVVETFETAITWDRFEDFHAAVTEAAQRAADEVCGAGLVTCRFTHVYPDGPAPYYSVYAPGRWGSQVAQWDDIKAAVSEAIIEAGGTITHHHAVGRDHARWYDASTPARCSAPCCRQRNGPSTRPASSTLACWAFADQALREPFQLGDPGPFDEHGVAVAQITERFVGGVEVGDVQRRDRRRAPRRRRRGCRALPPSARWRDGRRPRRRQVPP